jgi:hypothetical protein
MLLSFAPMTSTDGQHAKSVPRLSSQTTFLELCDTMEPWCTTGSQMYYSMLRCDRKTPSGYGHYPYHVTRIYIRSTLDLGSDDLPQHDATQTMCEPWIRTSLLVLLARQCPFGAINDSPRQARNCFPGIGVSPTYTIRRRYVTTGKGRI